MFSIILYKKDMYLAMLIRFFVLWICSLGTNKLWGVNHQEQNIKKCYTKLSKMITVDYYDKVLSQEIEE